VSSSAPDPQDSAGLPQPEPGQPQLPPETDADRTLLESVLRQTLEDDDSGVPLDDADRRALLKVADRHRGEPLSVDPIIKELVQALLQTHFRDLSGVQPFGDRACEEIAQALFDDPVAHGRLEQFWRRLCEAKS